jgi:thioredoxin reductase
VSAHDVVIVGGGPAGLAAARRLGALGIRDVVVLEREGQAGGVPRHCGHGGFGLGEFRRPMSGPAYARRLVREARRAEVRTATTVLEIFPGGGLSVLGPDGPYTLAGRKVLLALGARETPRSTRLIGGDRPWGITTSGAVQQFVYLERRAPFRRPVIVGTEWVSFSLLLTCRDGGMRPVAMLESSSRTAASPAAGLLARVVFGVPVLTEARLERIEGRERVERVVLERAGRVERIACDGVIFSGSFRPETALLKSGHLQLDVRTGYPAVDRFGRCSDRAYHAAGNVVHAAASAGRCFADGGKAAETIAADLAGRLPAP